MKLLRVAATGKKWSFSASVEIDARGTVTNLEPIVRFFVGRSEKEVRARAERHGWSVEEVE